MEYPKLNSLVPQGEHFDESAINGEGVWLSTGHVNAIENFLASDEVAKELETANTTIGTLNTKVSDLETAATKSANRITELEGQVAELGKKSSGSGTKVVTKADEHVDKKPVPSYLDDNNPANQFADKRIKRTSATK